MRVFHETAYKCDICGKVGVWSKTSWLSVTFYLGDNWEHEFHVCSKECDEKLLMLKRDGRKKLAQTIINT